MTVLAASAPTTSPRLRPLAKAWRRLGEPVSDRVVPGTLVIAGFAAVVGLLAAAFAWREQWLLLYPDAMSHLVIARRIVDSQNSGLFQLGTAWLPAPHVLLIPFVGIFPLYQSGIAGSLLGVACLAVSAGALWRLTSRVGIGRPAKLVVVAVFTLNPTTLFLSTTALTEPVLMAALLAAMAGLAGWITAMPAISPGELAVFAGIPSTIAVLSRYEGWAFVAMASVFVVVASWRRWQSLKYTTTVTLAYLGPPMVGVVWWLAYNFTRTGDPLDFLVGEYSAGVETARYAALGLIPTAGNLGLSLTVLNWSTVNIVGMAFLLAAFIGAGILMWTRGLTTTALLLWMTGFFYPFQLLTLYLGQTYIENPAALPPDSLTNNRYAYGVLPLVAILCGVLVDFTIARRRRLGETLAVIICVGALAFSVWNLAGARERMVVVQEGYFEQTPVEAIEAADWLRANYNGGGVLLDDDPQGILLRLGLPLSEVTNVFNGEIFLDTLKDPASHVDWLFVNVLNNDSPVWKTVSEDPGFTNSFVVVYEAGTYRVFRSIRSLDTRDPLAPLGTNGFPDPDGTNGITDGG